jgi:hypothetical protein
MENPTTSEGILIPADQNIHRSAEWLCSDAIERIARMIGVAVDMDEPEQALVAAVERSVAELVQMHRHLEVR